jgi:hypothetical protein
VQKGGRHGSVGRTNGGGTVVVGVGVTVDGGGSCTLLRGTQV